MEAVHGLHRAVRRWRLRLDFIGGEFICCWRSDASTYAIKTAQHLVLNEKLTIRKMFEIACMYCLEESVQNLFAEMEASGHTESFGTDDESMASFWVGWLPEGPQAVRAYGYRPILNLTSLSHVARLCGSL
ncbi:hypothetical protein AVEN_11345-1 [Araneus ventricosus]|uniref:Uncharacterized protein n=1 Tax=Araneus ventricosus TaxID=182803 RepID=A0A4Y2QAC6_ARAVE|nr:hypothetical protein AVEN_11345-1 [Araneus ventricosus]